MNKLFNYISEEEAADLILDGQRVACSGFTAAGSAKAVPRAIAKKAEKEHQEGKKFGIHLLAGASVGDAIDGSLARANAVLSKFPYQSNSSLRNSINAGSVNYADMHLSHFPQQINYQFYGKIDWAIIEVADFNDSGELVLTSSVGATPTFCQKADKIILEHNTFHPTKILGLHDIYTTQNPPSREPIPIKSPKDRIGSTTIKVDPKKIVGVVKTNECDDVKEFKESNEINDKIGLNVAKFFLGEIFAGRIPKSFLPIQSGVGNVANAVLKAMGENPEIPPFIMYSEVAQNAVIELMQANRITFTSATSLTVTEDVLQSVYNNWNEFKNRLILRPEEITNHPEIVRRLGILSINTAIEVDIFGHVNSTHVCGSNVMNGIGGSGDFTRNAYISIFTLPSTAKNGKISGIVPFCSHIDHTEHDVQVVITEYGIADLRFKSPAQRAETIINNCAHPAYKDLLLHYLSLQKNGHIKHNLNHSFAFHNAFLASGDMQLTSFN